MANLETRVTNLEKQNARKEPNKTTPPLTWRGKLQQDRAAWLAILRGVRNDNNS